MEYIDKIKKMLCKELDEYAMKGKLTMADLEPLQLMTDIVKNLDKIEMLEDGGYSEGRSYMHGSSYDDYSERRGRGRYAKRDSMGRYSSDDYSEDYRGSSYRGYDRRCSKDDAKDHMMNKLGMMMEDADPKEREALKECMRAIEKA